MPGPFVPSGVRGLVQNFRQETDMRFLLAIVLLLNSYAALAGPVCDTPGELMSSNFSGKAFTDICKKIVADDPGCKKLKPEKRMSCNAKKENQILSSSDLLAKAGQCLKGFAWDSMYELGKFILDMIKVLVGAQINSVKGMIKFLSDSEYREKTIASAKSGSKMGMAFLNSAGLYFSREFTRNLAKNPLNPMAAVGETLLKPLMKFITESVQAMAAHFIPQYQCMNGTAKLYTICRVLGELIMPPAILFTFLKGGIKAVQALKNGKEAAKFARVERKFSEANELSAAAQKAGKAPKPPKADPKPSRITVDNAPGSAAQTKKKPSALAPAPVVHPVKPAPAAPLTKPIEQYSADELIEIGRSEKADLALTAEDLNRAELAKLEAGKSTPGPLDIDVEVQKLIDETPLTPEMIAKYADDPEYALLFQAVKQSPEDQKLLSIVIKDMEKNNPQMSKAEIQSEVNRMISTCGVK